MVRTDDEASLPVDDNDVASPDSRTIYMVGTVTEPLTRAVVKGLLNAAERDSTALITLVISTSGGDVDCALAIHDVMRFCTAPIRTVGIGRVMSAGCLLLATGAKGERYLGRNARLMYHYGWEQHSGDPFDHQTELTEFKRQNTQYDQLVAIACGKTLKQVEGLYLPERKNNYLTAAKAKAFGFADKLI